MSKVLQRVPAMTACEAHFPRVVARWVWSLVTAVASVSRRLAAMPSTEKTIDGLISSLPFLMTQASGPHGKPPVRHSLPRLRRKLAVKSTTRFLTPAKPPSHGHSSYSVKTAYLPSTVRRPVIASPLWVKLGLLLQLRNSQKPDCELVSHCSSCTALVPRTESSTQLLSKPSRSVVSAVRR